MLFLILFIFLYIFFYISSIYLNKKVVFYRRQRRDYENMNTKNLVKVLMNKQEIMQTQKISYEIKILNELNDKEIFYNKKMSVFLIFCFMTEDISFKTISP